MIRPMVLTAFLSTINPSAAGLSAQGEPPRPGVFVRVGAGVAHATAHTTSGGQKGATGPIPTLHLGLGGRRFQGLLEVQWQPFTLPLPDEGRSLRQLHFLGSLQWFLTRQAYVRGGIGVAHQAWADGGGDPSSAVLGVTVGFEAPVLRRWLAFEALWRGTYSLCFSDCGFAGTRLLGAQVLVPFY